MQIHKEDGQSTKKLCLIPKQKWHCSMDPFILNLSICWHSAVDSFLASCVHKNGGACCLLSIWNKTMATSGSKFALIQALLTFAILKGAMIIKIWSWDFALETARKCCHESHKCIPTLARSKQARTFAVHWSLYKCHEEENGKRCKELITLLSCLSHWTGCVWKIWQNGTCGFWTSKRTLIRQRLMHHASKQAHSWREQASRNTLSQVIASCICFSASCKVTSWVSLSLGSCHTLSSRQFKSVCLLPEWLAS